MNAWEIVSWSVVVIVFLVLGAVVNSSEECAAGGVR